MRTLPLAAVLTLALAAPASAAEWSVEATDYQFSPRPLNVAVGDTVTWTNAGPSQHTATSAKGQAVRWDSPYLDAGQTYSKVFDTPGKYQYFCRPHVFMKGVITVGSDEVAKSFAKLRTVRKGSRVKASFRLREPAKVVGKLRGATKRTVSAKRLKAGARSLSWGKLRPGSYKATLTFTDDFDKTSRAKLAFEGSPLRAAAPASGDLVDVADVRRVVGLAARLGGEPAVEDLVE
jgi:plastocyanin